MKPTAPLRHFFALAGSSLLSISYSYAATLYWDSNGVTAGFGTANGTWGTSAFWSADNTGSSATANTTILATDDIHFGTTSAGYTGGRTVTISGTKTANSITIGSASGAITLSGGQFDLGNANTIITQNSASDMTIASVIGGGTNGLTKAGSGRLILTGVNTYTGNTVVTDGILRFGTSYNTSWVNGRLPAASNLEINGGIVEAWYYLTRALGAGSGEIQITGGRSGFTNLQGDATSNFVTFGTTGTTVTWGDPAFNPSTFVMNDVGAAAVMRIANHFDLNGAARTIEVSATGAGGGRGTYGILTGDLSGTGASLVKTGNGTLMLDGANTYDGGTTINGGGVWFRDTAAMPASGTVTVNDGGILSVGVGTGLWTTGTSGVGTIGGLLAGDGGQTASQVVYNGNMGIGLNISGTQSYGGDIGNVGSSLSLHVGNKDGSASSDPFTFAGTLTLTGNNTYTGGTFINVGTLIAGSATALGNGGDIAFNGGTLQYTASSAATDYGSRIKNSSKVIALNTNGQDVTLSNLGSGNTGGLTKTGGGTLTFTGANTYSGATTVSGGAIAVYNGTLSTSGAAVSLASNTTLSVTGGIGVNSTWNLGTQDLQQSGSNVTNVQVTIDGDGVAGSALVTNVRNLIWGRTLTNSTLTLTDGGQMNVTGEVRIGNPYYNLDGGANMNIGGGTATSTFSGDGGDDFYIGYGERRNSNNNVVTVSSNGVLTNVRDMFVGNVNNQQNASAVNPSTANKLTVTGTGTASMRGISVGYAQAAGIVTQLADANANVVEVTSGGQLSTTGTAYIGRANNNYTASNANTLTVTGTGSSWNAGNQNVFVGYTTSATATSNNNILTVGAGASLTNVAVLTVGSGGGAETGNKVVLNGGSISATAVSVSADNTLAGSGSITGNTTIAGSLEIGVDGTSVDLIAITGDLDISAATLSIVPTGSGANQPSYTFLTYTGTLTPSGGPFFAEGTLPVGYSIDYSTPGQIKLVSGGGPTGFDAWKLTGSLGPVTFNGDTNGDGVKDGLAFLLGVANPDDDANGSLPTVSEDGSGNLVMQFNCLPSSARGTAQLRVAHSNTLAGWSATVAQVPNATDLVPDNNVTFVVGAGPAGPPATNSVTATIGVAAAAGGKLFGRLEAVNP